MVLKLQRKNVNKDIHCCLANLFFEKMCAFAFPKIHICVCVCAFLYIHIKSHADKPGKTKGEKEEERP